MKKIFSTLVFFIVFFCSTAQLKWKAILVDSAGKSKLLSQARLENLNLKNFKQLLVYKNYRDTLFEKLQYNANGPLQNFSTYHDSLFTIKEGRYFEYFSNGIIFKEGQFVKNKKEGTWYIYNNQAKPIYEYEYLNDILKGQKAINLQDTIKEDFPAYYRGGDSVFSHMIGKGFEYLIRANKIKHGGYASIRFMIDTSGKMKNIYFSKSYNFVFDEQCLMVIRSVPNNWIPATKKGGKINSFREQPVVLKFNPDSTIKIE